MVHFYFFQFSLDSFPPSITAFFSSYPFSLLLPLVPSLLPPFYHWVKPFECFKKHFSLIFLSMPIRPTLCKALFFSSNSNALSINSSKVLVVCNFSSTWISSFSPLIKIPLSIIRSSFFKGADPPSNSSLYFIIELICPMLNNNPNKFCTKLGLKHRI